MTIKSSQKSNVRTLGLLMIPLFLAACASAPDPRGPESRKGDRQAKGEDGAQRPTRTSGTFIRPISLVFADMDNNGDKALSLDELDAGIEKEWSSFDRAPSAVYFSNWSLKTFGSTDASPTFMMFDKDLNGVVTKSEFATLFTDRFRRFDTNADELLERAELIVAVEAPRGQRSRGGQSEGNGQGRGQRGGGRPPR